uniref:Uncharacterized protein n=1 Tax=Panagrolaimus sp. ES5 TaxID=591445 RepID=A0AC34FTA8_9BILA
MCYLNTVAQPPYRAASSNSISPIRAAAGENADQDATLRSPQWNVSRIPFARSTPRGPAPYRNNYVSEETEWSFVGNRSPGPSNEQIATQFFGHRPPGPSNDQFATELTGNRPPGPSNDQFATHLTGNRPPGPSNVQNVHMLGENQHPLPGLEESLEDSILNISTLPAVFNAALGIYGQKKLKKLQRAKAAMTQQHSSEAYGQRHPQQYHRSAQPPVKLEESLEDSVLNITSLPAVFNAALGIYGQKKLMKLQRAKAAMTQQHSSEAYGQRHPPQYHRSAQPPYQQAASQRLQAGYRPMHLNASAQVGMNLNDFSHPQMPSGSGNDGETNSSLYVTANDITPNPLFPPVDPRPPQ